VIGSLAQVVNREMDVLGYLSMGIRPLGARLLAAIVMLSLAVGGVPMAAAAGMGPMCPTTPCDTPAFTCCCNGQAPTAPAPSAAVSVAASVLRAGGDHPMAAAPMLDLFATSFLTQRVLLTVAAKPPADRLTLLSTLLI
jgi:hypothetical protein